MQQFLDGVKPPNKKINISENQKEDRNKVYELTKGNANTKNHGKKITNG